MQGPPSKSIAWATEMTEFANRTLEDQTTLWNHHFGSPLGTVSWNTLVASRARYAANMMTIMAEEEFHDRLEDGEDFLSDVPTVDYLRKFVFGQPGQSVPQIGAVAESVTAAPTPGHFSEAMAFGPHVAELVGRLTGTTPSFYVDAYGTFGQVTWMTLYPDMAALDEAQDKLMASDEYMSAVERGTALYVAESGQRGLAMRIA